MPTARHLPKQVPNIGIKPIHSRMAGMREQNGYRVAGQQLRGSLRYRRKKLILVGRVL
jgi:hypothetical protein